MLGVMFVGVNCAASSSSSLERSSRSADQAQSLCRLPEVKKRLEEACRSLELFSVLAPAQGSPRHSVVMYGRYRQSESALLVRQENESALAVATALQPYHDCLIGGTATITVSMRGDGDVPDG